MTFNQFKELWMMRFEKILKGEEEAVAFYRGLLGNNCVLENASIKVILEQILKDEKKHVRIANRLIHLVNGKKAVLSKEEKIDDKNKE